MSRDDWYRRNTWTDEDRRQFHERNARSRGDYNKSQYLKIQAWALLSAGGQREILGAVELLKEFIEKYSDQELFVASAHLAMAKCCLKLSDSEKAIQYFRSSLELMRRYPTAKENTCYDFGMFAVEHSRTDLFDEVLTGLDEYGDNIFPYGKYKDYGIRAAIHHSRGELELAREYALKALKEAEVKDSGLGWGRAEVGLVGDTDTRFHEIILEIAGQRRREKGIWTGLFKRKRG